MSAVSGFVLGVTCCVAFGFASGQSETIGIVDDRGVLRCEIGKLGGPAAYGLRLFAPDGGRVVSIASADDGVEATFGADGAGQVVVSSRVSGGGEVLVRGAGGALISLSNEGERQAITCYGRRGEPKVELSVSGASGPEEGCLLVSGKKEDGRAVGWRLASSAESVELVGVCGGDVGIAVRSGPESVGLRVGDVASRQMKHGVEMVAKNDGAAWTKVNTGLASVTLNSGESEGAGILVVSPDGRPAVRVGVTGSGDLVDQVLDAQGKLINR